MDNNDLKNALFQAFAEEAPELLLKVETALFALESPDDDKLAHCDALKRALHSLKGSASAIGRDDIRNVSHALESIVQEMNTAEISYDDIDKLHFGLSYLKSASAEPQVKADAEDILVQLNQGLTALPESQAADTPENEVPDESGSAGPIIADSSSDKVQEAPQAEALQEETATEKTERPGNKELFNVETIRVGVRKIENMQSSVGELVAIRLQQEDGFKQLVEMQNEVARANADWRLLKNELNEIRQLLPHNIISRLDARAAKFSTRIKLMQSQVFQLSKQTSSQTGQLGLLSDEMDGGLRDMRMMPLAPFLESFRVVAREAASQLGKAVYIECEDKGIEVDRLILEKIKEPILHLVRNCVGHGIETSEQRLAKGKSERGKITLKAELNGDYVCIQVRDDGAGFEKQAIYNKAVKLGLIKELDELTDDKIMELVSIPGFSTASKTDMVSGRGVGMDVVASMVSELGGTISLETETDRGSCFTLQVPLSLATTQGLILQVGAHRFGIVLDMVERIVRTKIESLRIVDGKQMLYIDDEPVAVTSLAAIFGLNELEPKGLHVARPMVILRSGSQRLALIVDDVPGEIPMIIKSMGPQYDHIKIYTGGVILSDGGVLPIVDARRVINMVSENSGLKLDDRIEDLEEDFDLGFTETETNHLVVVVDDSITTRTLERNILESAGYRVAVATDGVEALDLLMVEDNVSLVVTDMEMPKMDGIELCRNIRSGRHSELPIIMVTSVGNDEEKRRGLEAGADAYIIKSEFQQDKFLDTVHRFVQH